MDESGVLEFLTSLEAMELPDQIEEVNAKILDKIVEEQEFVAVLFCEYEGSLRISVLVVAKREGMEGSVGVASGGLVDDALIVV